MIIYGSSDATLNPAGVRIGTAEIHAQIEQIPEVVEAICIGQDWEHDVRVVLLVRDAIAIKATRVPVNPSWLFGKDTS